MIPLKCTTVQERIPSNNFNRIDKRGFKYWIDPNSWKETLPNMQGQDIKCSIVAR